MSALAVPVCGAQPQEARALEADWAAEARGRAGGGGSSGSVRSGEIVSGESHHIWYVTYFTRWPHRTRIAQRTVRARAPTRARARLSIVSPCHVPQDLASFGPTLVAENCTQS